MTPAAFEPMFLGICAALAVWYLRAARHDRVPISRRLAFLAGLVLIAGALNSPLEWIAIHRLVSAHLVQNAMIADWAPPLLIIGLTPALRAAILKRRGRPFRVFTRPAAALTLWLVAWYVTHLPLLYDGALRHPRWLNLEHAVLITAGVLFWWAVLAERPQGTSHGLRLALVLAGSLLAGPLGFAFIFSPDPFYGYYVHRPPLFGLSRIGDQHLGGIFMNAEQALVMFAAAAYLFKRWLDDEAAAGEVDAGLERPHILQPDT